MADDQWWFDLKTKTAVQESKLVRRSVDRLGPYRTREEAERAMERVQERNDAYDNDPRWNDDL